MRQLEEIYQETIIHHNKSPRNFKVLNTCNHSIHGKNPLCGDDYMLYVDIDEEKQTIKDISFHGDGCAVSKSSASLMTEIVKGMPLSEINSLKDKFIEMVTEDSSNIEDLPRKLQVFQGVREFPMRVKCATLIWRSLEALLNNNQQEITTEE